MIPIAPWVMRLAEAEPSDELRYEDMRDIYVYLRSTRNMLARCGNEKLGKMNMGFVKRKLEHLFKKEGFESIDHIQQTVRSLSLRGLGPHEEYKDKKAALQLDRKGIEKETDAEKKSKSYLKQGMTMQRGRNWQWRLEVAITESIEAKWWPMFGTYTVDPRLLPKGCLTRDDLWKKTDAWNKFVHQIKRTVAIELGYGKRPSEWPKGNTYFKYWACLEHGSGKAEHPHVHVVWLMKTIPKEWRRDPNSDAPGQMETDIRAASALWKWGNQKRTMALMITGSPFIDKLGWKIPRKSEEEPGTIGSPGKIAGYVSKYITKGGTRKWHHRVKATKGLGLEKILSQLETEVNPELLRSLAQRPEHYSLSMKIQKMSSCPMSLIREKSKQALWRRLHTTKRQQGSDSIRKEWTKKPQEFFTKYLKSVRAGAKYSGMMQTQRYNCYTLLLPEVEEKIHSEKNVLTMIEWLCKMVPVMKVSEPYVLLREG